MFILVGFDDYHANSSLIRYFKVSNKGVGWNKRAGRKILPFFGNF